MRVVIETMLNIEGIRGSSRGEFFVRDRDFKDDLNFAVAVLAYEWIQQQWRESGCRDLIIELVTWNEENDITEDVRQTRQVVKNDLLF